MTIEGAVSDYVSGYEFRQSDGGSYAPTNAERAMLEDAIEGYLAMRPHDPDVKALVDALGEAQRLLREDGWGRCPVVREIDAALAPFKDRGMTR